MQKEDVEWWDAQPNRFACLLRVVCAILPEPYRVDIGHWAFSRLTTPLWHGSDWHEDNHLVPNFEALFGQERAEISGKAFIALQSSACTKCGGDPTKLLSQKRLSLLKN
jgi:hypothetical protein